MTIKHAPNQYGWTANAAGETVKHKDEQAVIKEMLNWQEQGIGPGAIANCMDARGHSPRRGTRWTATSIRNILERQADERDEKAGIVPTVETRFESPAIPGALSEEYTCEDGSTVSIPAGSAGDMQKYGRVEVTEEPYVDRKTNKLKKGKGASWDAEDFKNLEARTLAEKRLTVLERAERLKFENPVIQGSFGSLLYPEEINRASLVTTLKAMKPLEDLIDEITAQPRVKRDIRMAAKALFNELAGERQFRLYLVARLRKLEQGAGEQS